ncbi:MAG: L,D-transpeptidase family protein [Gemmatimonadales bacterium]|nr:L,D-transpeptidase family protein [Gemmatimonadales bacterium]
MRAEGRRVAAWLLLGAAPSVLAAQSEAPAQATLAAVHPATPEAATLQRLVAAPALASMRHPDVSDVRAGMRRLYERAGWSLRWTETGRPTPALRAAVQRFLAAGAHGLEPADYDATAHDSVLARLERGEALAPDSLAAFDARVSASVLRYVGAMRHGRVRLGWKEDTLVARRPSADVEPQVDSILRAPEPALAFAQLDARGAGYPRLMAALARARHAASDSSLALPAIRPPVKPGSRLVEASGLRAFLVGIGEPVATPAGLEPGLDTVYDASLVEAVQSFQRAEGLKADGVLGQATLDKLARAPAWRVRQLELALERWRQLPDAPDSTYIRVNIPEFRLRVMQPTLMGWQEQVNMAVVVGGGGRNQTPEMVDSVETIVFRPYWNVTPRIMRDELKPKAMEDSTYLAKQGMELVKGRTVVPATPENLALIGDSVRIRQTPGAQNALGKVKFVFPNALGIYLHDTPTRSTFRRDRRAESHGCVRLEDAPSLARWMLRDQPEWTEARMREAMNGTKPVDAKLTSPIPIRLEYATVTVAEDGTLHRYPDVYGRDGTLDRVLRSGYPYPAKATPVKAILNPSKKLRS